VQQAAAGGSMNGRTVEGMYVRRVTAWLPGPVLFCPRKIALLSLRRDAQRSEFVPARTPQP